MFLPKIQDLTDREIDNYYKLDSNRKIFNKKHRILNTDKNSEHDYKLYNFSSEDELKESWKNSRKVYKQEERFSKEIYNYHLYSNECLYFGTTTFTDESLNKDINDLVNEIFSIMKNVSTNLWLCIDYGKEHRFHLHYLFTMPKSFNFNNNKIVKQIFEEDKYINKWVLNTSFTRKLNKYGSTVIYKVLDSKKDYRRVCNYLIDKTYLFNQSLIKEISNKYSLVKLRVKHAEKLYKKTNIKTTSLYDFIDTYIKESINDNIDNSVSITNVINKVCRTISRIFNINICSFKDIVNTFILENSS